MVFDPWNQPDVPWNWERNRIPSDVGARRLDCEIASVTAAVLVELRKGKRFAWKLQTISDGIAHHRPALSGQCFADASSWYASFFTPSPSLITLFQFSISIFFSPHTLSTHYPYIHIHIFVNFRDASAGLDALYDSFKSETSKHYDNPNRRKLHLTPSSEMMSNLFMYSWLLVR